MICKFVVSARPSEFKVADDVCCVREILFHCQLFPYAISEAKRECADLHVIYELAVDDKSIGNEISRIGEVLGIMHHSCERG